jgi:putative transposase
MDENKRDDLKNFYWQDGYGAFSVNPAQIDTVIKYIANQKAHHCNKTPGVNLEGFLKKV